MLTKGRIAWVLVLRAGSVLGAVLLVAAAHPAGAQTLPPESWLMPFDIGQRHRPAGDIPPVVTQQDQVYDFIWQSFIALNWPQLPSGSRGEPDTQATLAPWNDDPTSPGPVVWETYRRPNEVFTRPAEWPIQWNDPPQQQCGAGSADIVIASSTQYGTHSDVLNQPFDQANYPTGPVADQNGNYLRYEVGLSQAFFSYISHFRYYRQPKQRGAVKRFERFVERYGSAPAPSNNPSTPYFQEIPNGTEGYLTTAFDLPEYAHTGIVEWKSAWKRLEGSDDPQRFYRRSAYFVNPNGLCEGPHLVGLVGLHIHRRTQFGHVGATFEQVDNVRLQPEYSSQQVPGATPLPPHASLNPGGEISPILPNGYEVCDSQGQNCQGGVGGGIPAPIPSGALLPLDPAITNVVRQVEIPVPVQASNAKWRLLLEGSVFFYYQLIGTQNPNVEAPNPTLGPGVLGAQASNTNNLINTALESYTQQGYSCAGCHQNAAPLGVSLPFPPIEQRFRPLHTISFVLQNAKTNRD